MSTRQKSLPFDKQEYAAAMEAIKTATIPGPTRTRNAVRRFLVELFRGQVWDADACEMRHLSGPDGTATFRYSELAELLDVSKSTIERRIRAACDAGVLERVSSTDEDGRKRTTVAFVWSALGVKPNRQTDGLLADQTVKLTVPNRQVERPNRQTDGLDIYRTRARTTTTSNIQLLQQEPAGGPWLSLEYRLASMGVRYPARCVAAARRRGMDPAAVCGELDARPTLPPEAVARHLIHGAALTPPRRRVASSWRDPATEAEERIIKAGRRAGRPEHEIAADVRAALEGLQ